MNQGRDRTIDALRGLAILIMIASNSSATCYAEPHPYWFRCLGSVAAPLFITLSGMMIRFSQLRKDYAFSYFMKRGLMLIGVGAFLDVAAWQMFPFTSFDVLYVIGISAPIAFLFGRINKPTLQWLVIAVIFLLAPVLQHFFGYTTYPSEYNLDGSFYIEVENQTSILNHLFIDGWFPVFPWLGFALLGVMLADYRWCDVDFRSSTNAKIVLLALCCLVIGILLKIVFPVELIIRDGFGEVFLPPTVGFCIYSVGIVLALFWVYDKVVVSKVFEPMVTIGRSSLFLYVLQWFSINYVFRIFFAGLNGIRFFLFWLCFAAFFVCIAYVLKFLKARWKPRPWFFRLILGG